MTIAHHQRLIMTLTLALAFATLPVSASLSYQPDSIATDFDAEPDTIVVIADESEITRPGRASLQPAQPQPADMPKWAQLMAKSEIKSSVDHTRLKSVDPWFRVMPFYSSLWKLGVRANAMAAFRLNRYDLLPQPSMVTMQLRATFKGYFMLRSRARLYMPDRRQRVNIDIEGARKPLHFWGITVDDCRSNERSKYIRLTAGLKAEYLYRPAGHFWFGPSAHASYVDGIHFGDASYIQGQPDHSYVTGLGLTAAFDSRDHAVSPSRGFYAAYRPMIYPARLGSCPLTFWSHRIDISAYMPLWRGATGAMNLFGAINSAGTPWTMLEMAGDDDVHLRGYTPGRYMANNHIGTQLEIRQHLWNRLGLTAWGGISSMFSAFTHSSPRWSGMAWLPNYGFGFRLRLRPRINMRADIGFGRGCRNFCVGIGEAF